MSRTLLQLIQQGSGEMGLAQPSSVIGSSITQTLQFLALTQRLGLDLIREYEWRRLTKAYIFLPTNDAYSSTGTTTEGSTGVSGLASTGNLQIGDVVSGEGIPPYTEVDSIFSSTFVFLNRYATATGPPTLTFSRQDYALPGDFNRMIDDTQWDRTNSRMNTGAQSSQYWQAVQGGLITRLTSSQYRLYNNALRIFPAPATIVSLGYEYVSNYWVLAGSTPKAAFTIDSDTCVFPDDLMLAGIKYYFLKAKRLDYSAELAEFSEKLSLCKSQDQPAMVQSLARTYSDNLVGNIPDGNWTLT